MIEPTYYPPMSDYFPTATRTVGDTISKLAYPKCMRLAPSLYVPPADVLDRCKIGLAVESMRNHMTDEGWQIFKGLEECGYHLFGYNLSTTFRAPTVEQLRARIDPNKAPPHNFGTNAMVWANLTNVSKILSISNPSTVVVQDKREWDVKPGDFREVEAKFDNITHLRDRWDIFKVTILKDSQQRPTYHRESALEMGCHAWIVYYHPRIVNHLAPYTRPEHLIRTYHSIDGSIVPEYRCDGESKREGCLLSGAVSDAYPLRTKLVDNLRGLYDTFYLPHPGYHRNGCATPSFMQELSGHKVAICTSSRYGYALRKIIEATACGCVVVTDLPTDDVLPEIDGNLIRVHPEIKLHLFNEILEVACKKYDPARQSFFSEKALGYYNYRSVCGRLVEDIDKMRESYNAT